MRMPRYLILALALALLVAGQRPGLGSDDPATAGTPYLTGQLLVATPKMGDPRFRKSVIYMVAHDAKGAMGVIVNKVHSQVSLARLMKGFGIDPERATGTVDLHFGGPVRPTGGFILHTGDYAAPSSRPVDGAISFTTDLGVLRAMAAGKGPRRVLFALGYAGWGAGQLENEMARGDWMVATATEGLIFGDEKGDAWERASGAAGLPL